eukprot:3949062-Karenia_brevis.AAC.1
MGHPGQGAENEETGQEGFRAEFVDEFWYMTDDNLSAWVFKLCKGRKLNFPKPRKSNGRRTGS